MLHVHRQTRDTDRALTGAGRRRVPRLREIFGRTAMASILMFALGCDKHAGPSAAEPAQTILAGKPNVLFLLFGDRADPRILPVATLADGRVEPITLDSAGWRGFDGLYFREGAPVIVYENGRTATTAVLRRGMWRGDAAALYALPGCRAARPIAAVRLASAPGDAVMTELLATSEPLATEPVRAEATLADLDSARRVGVRAAEREGMHRATQAALTLSVRAIATGASPRPTLAASFSEPDGGSARHRDLFVLADATRAAEGYVPTYVLAADDSVPEFRRYLDHLDLTGDGVDEIVLEGWRLGGDSYLVVLTFDGGRWRELLRGAASWCADRR